MRKILMILLISLCFSCADDRPLPGALTGYLPPNPAVILQMQNPDLFFNNLQNNEFIKSNLDHEVSQNIIEPLSVLSYFPLKNEALLTLLEGEKNEVQFSFISRGNLAPTALDSIANRQVETLTTKDLKIRKYILEGKTAFSAQIDSVTIISNSKKLLENGIFGTHRLSPGLETAFKAASPKKTSVFINHSRVKNIFGKIFPDFLQNFSQWTVLDAEISQTQLNFDGISIPSDTISQHLKLFANAGISQNRLAEVTPVNSTGFTSITYRDFDILYQNLQKRPLEGISSEVSLLQNASEAGVISFAEDKVFAIRSLDPEATRLSLDFNLQPAETHREISIFEYPHSAAFEDLLQPLLAPKELQVFAFLDTWIIFAKNAEVLKNIISSVQSDLVLANTDAYKAAAQNLSSEASILMLRNNQAAADASDGLNYDDFPISAVQFVPQENFAHVHAILEKSQALTTKNAAAQIAAIDLGARLASKPVFFKNHRTKGMDVAVQDVENTLYLISSEGKIFWKKQLNAPILGAVQTVDLLRNGRYQLAFATQNELHVIDRDGNLVKPFPLKFRDDITQPLAIFDYDNKRDYRFVITQGRELYMYDRKGKAVRGFTFSRAGSEIIQPPKHIRLDRKDYILVPESSGKLNILSRTGKSRVPVKEKIEFSENDWYEYNSNFVSTNSSGQILKVSENGSIKRENLDLAENTRITATASSLVMLSENELRIGSNTATLDFGLYTHPQIFYITKKTYVSTTDLQTSRVFLFDGEANLLPGFPIYGNSNIDLSNADDDTALELVVQGEENGVLVYEVNP